jgi:hypothetical protein
MRTIYADATVGLERNGGPCAETAKLLAGFYDSWVVRSALRQHEPPHWSGLDRRLRPPETLGLIGVWTGIAAMVISVAVTLVPARAAWPLLPVEILRYE